MVIVFSRSEISPHAESLINKGVNSLRRSLKPYAIIVQKDFANGVSGFIMIELVFELQKHL